MKVPIATHEVEQISFVAIDPRDSHAFGYIYNTSDERHQFWVIKTERPAATAVLIIKELFEVVFELYTKSQDASVSKSAITSTPDSSSQVSTFFFHLTEKFYTLDYVDTRSTDVNLRNTIINEVWNIQREN